MTVRALDPETGDIVTSGVQFVSDQIEIAQTITTRLRLFSGEYFRDVNDGTPWFQVILDKASTLTQKDAAIKRRIAETDGVIELLSYSTDFDINQRGYTVQCEVQTEFGLVNVSTSSGDFL
ncbi:MAG: hypothetical protein KAR42_11095 [candidate division Zixibacteria bacterium]|nr:hypothetical protein [candidate division Zixibacteria bacterium]